MLNKLSYLFIFFAAYFSAPLAMSCDHFKPEEASEEVKEVKLLKAVSAKERYNFARDILSFNPCNKMPHKIPDKLWSFYERDVNFIRNNISERDNEHEIMRHLQDLENIIKERGFHKEMSFADYVFVAYMWAHILSSGHKDDYEINTDFFQRSFKVYDEMIDETYQYGNILLKKRETPWISNYYLQCLGSTGIALPHVSKTGAAPVLLINESWGFYTTTKAIMVSHLDFVAVGTNEKLHFDSSRNQTCLTNWHHDVGAHMFVCRRFYDKEWNDAAQLKIRRAAALRAAISNKEVAKAFTDDQKAKLELAFFEAFHENNFGMRARHGFKATIQALIDDVTIKLSAPIELEPGSVTKSAEAYETNVLRAKSLKISIDGNDIREQQTSFLRALKEGYEVLITFADAYDTQK